MEERKRLFNALFRFVCDTHGGYSHKQARLANIRNYVTPEFPPAFLTDGSHGSFEAQGKALAQALRRQGVAVSELFFPPEAEEAVHEYQFHMKMPLAGQCYDQVCNFLRARQLI